ncbi:hypothetical protein [Scytonema sp. HK-05]|uniref:hypothetical protein n=1 Tax=Scytonema sp. HK-05 TaxID=1137095 RepID=UPI000B30E4E7|nr:hypothetical protein [Scytonema sp. HK-05]
MRKLSPSSPRQSPQRGEPPHGETALQEGLPPQATAFTEGVPKAYPKGAGSSSSSSPYSYCHDVD